MAPGSKNDGSKFKFGKAVFKHVGLPGYFKRDPITGIYTDTHKIVIKSKKLSTDPLVRPEIKLIKPSNDPVDLMMRKQKAFTSLTKKI
jgi:hypothetical protein